MGQLCYLKRRYKIKQQQQQKQKQKLRKDRMVFFFKVTPKYNSFLRKFYKHLSKML